MRKEIVELLKDGPEQRLVVGPIVERLIGLGWEQKQIIFGKNEWKIPKTPSEASKREKNAAFDYFPVDVAVFDSVETTGDYRHLLFIIECKQPDTKVFTNPPFGAPLKVKYSDAKKADLSIVDYIDNGKDIELGLAMFNRCCDLLKPGGKMCIVLPETYFFSPSYKYVNDHAIFSSNIDSVSLKIGLQFLYASMGKDVYGDILELMPYIQGDAATTIAVTRLIVEYLETTDTVILPIRVEAIVLQNALQWIHSENLDIRWNATRILFLLSRNSENYGVINHQLVTLIDSNGVHIKNLIMKHLHIIDGITDKTKEYIVSKCKHDANFVVRMVCAEEEQKRMSKE